MTKKAAMEIADGAVTITEALGGWIVAHHHKGALIERGPLPFHDARSMRSEMRLRVAAEELGRDDVDERIRRWRATNFARPWTDFI